MSKTKQTKEEAFKQFMEVFSFAMALREFIQNKPDKYKEFCRLGKQVFGTDELFVEWLKEPNFFFDGKAPLLFLSTEEGIKYIMDRLTGIEYGDNA